MLPFNNYFNNYKTKYVGLVSCGIENVVHCRKRSTNIHRNTAINIQCKKYFRSYQKFPIENPFLR